MHTGYILVTTSLSYTDILRYIHIYMASHTFIHKHRYIKCIHAYNDTFSHKTHTCIQTYTHILLCKAVVSMLLSFFHFVKSFLIVI